MAEKRAFIDAGELSALTVVCSVCGTGLQLDMSRQEIKIHHFTQCQGCGRNFQRGTLDALRYYRDYFDALQASKRDEYKMEFKFSVPVE